MPDPKPATRTEQVYAELRNDIVRGLYTPGQRLRLVELAERFSASQSVVREALTRLAEQKLVVALPQQGFRVMTLTRESVEELTEARAEIEATVLRLSIERGDIAWESAVLAAHHRLSRNGSEVDAGGRLSEEWAAAHEDFHRMLLAGCGNSWLIDLATTLRAAAVLHRNWATSVAHDYERDVAGEHRALLDAALARDVDLAVDVLAEHIRRTGAALLTITDEDDA
ncbi:GntR family transcriptional regulator [Umezawaea endophytica]|uniref:GntR family transcriptional regulator n=1 Tax=Umezawaea endophytica TaxID=1654476 RepID=A0A9X3AIE1_9PSEU|nr:GntR family transcriptional regulator [Umezawaea endophytica]MCS7480450.1 GntR family transcriptional regulator [Umezawaea endophytica]